MWMKIRVYYKLLERRELLVVIKGSSIKKKSWNGEKTALRLLKKYWGYNSFLPRQSAIVSSVMKGNDTLAILATGAGKSICYQIPALYFGGLTLVISPLVALMKDQVDDLNGRGIPAVSWTGALSQKDRIQIKNDIRKCRIRLLFASPEKCMQADFLETLDAAPVRLIAIDEAHCISEWGHDFRQDYRQLVRLRRRFPEVPVIALTATATPDVRDDICNQLELKKVRKFVGSFNRRNLNYQVLERKDNDKDLIDFLTRHKNEPGIVYCMSRQESVEMAGKFRKMGFYAMPYHAGLPRAERDNLQESFMQNKVRIICATIAFGMGVNKPDVRFVVHTRLPKNLESYYQETGRAGRDGKPAECLLLYSRKDEETLGDLILNDLGNEKIRQKARLKIRHILSFCELSGCRKRFLLAYFGEESPRDHCRFCKKCNYRDLSTLSGSPQNINHPSNSQELNELSRVLITPGDYPVPSI